MEQTNKNRCSFRMACIFFLYWLTFNNKPPFFWHFFYYILTIVFIMTDCNIFTLYLYWLTFMDEWFLVIIQVWFLLWKFHDYCRGGGKKSIILIIIVQGWEITEILSNGISSNIVCEISQSCLTWPSKFWDILQRT